MWASLLISAAIGNSAPAPLESIGFGSCINQDKKDTLFGAIVAAKPSAFVFLGDNMYLDQNGSSGDFDKEYAKLAANPDFDRLTRSSQIFATWDDHDFGLNDAGVEFPRKAEAQQAFMRFWKTPADSPLRKREGVYDAQIIGPEGKRVQIILLDTRYFRSPLLRGEKGGYAPDPDPSKTMLGPAQWTWLTEELRKPAELRIICSSIQVVPDDHPFEKWSNLPKEREKLFGAIRDAKAAGVVFISGDRHLGEISAMDGGIGYPIYDVTSSAINRSSTGWRFPEVNSKRVGSIAFGNNFGLIRVDWGQSDPIVRLQLRDDEGEILFQQKLRLSWLQPGKIKPKN